MPPWLSGSTAGTADVGGAGAERDERDPRALELLETAELDDDDPPVDLLSPSEGARTSDGVPRRTSVRIPRRWADSWMPSRIGPQNAPERNGATTPRVGARAAGCALSDRRASGPETPAFPLDFHRAAPGSSPHCSGNGTALPWRP